jgi:hypothetical protein
MKEILLERKSGCQQIGAQDPAVLAAVPSGGAVHGWVSKPGGFGTDVGIGADPDLGVSGTIRGIGKEPAVRGDRGVELDKFLRNDGGRKFKDVTASAGVGDAGFGASATWLDYGRGLHREHHGLLRRMGSRRP